MKCDRSAWASTAPIGSKPRGGRQSITNIQRRLRGRSVSFGRQGRFASCRRGGSPRGFTDLTR